MRPIQPLVRLPHSHIDPNWLSTMERASRTPAREFYEWAADHILRVTGSLPRSRPAGWNLRRSRRVRFQANPIVHRVAETLFAAQVPLRRLHRDVSQQELNLLQFTAGLMAKTGTRPTEVVRCEERNLTLLCFLLHDTPNDLGAESSAPDPASLVDQHP
jgi:hypothetical protein